MEELTELLSSFWTWAESSYGCKCHDVSRLSFPPFYFPEFTRIREICIQQINTGLLPQQIDIFLTCMALDSEAEEILDACKTQGTDEFLEAIILCGINHPQSEARWQVCELLRRDIPDKYYFLNILCNDVDPYVRKRANNVSRDNHS